MPPLPRAACRLVVKIARPGLPRLSLVDLPGIREVSESMREATKQLTRHYVSDANTVVLCVVSATKTLQVGALESRVLPTQDPLPLPSLRCPRRTRPSAS